MSEQSFPSATQYRKVLSQMLKVSRENSHLWDYLPGDLPFFSVVVDAQDNDYLYYGISREGAKIAFSREAGHTNPLITRKGEEIVAMGAVIETLQRYQFPIETLKSHFLVSIADPLRKYEESKAKIEQKVKKKLMNLEDSLD